MDDRGVQKTALVELEEYTLERLTQRQLDYPNILSVSHCWEAQQHPDPYGSQARSLLKLLSDKEMWDDELFSGSDIWIFVDVIWLWVKNRYPNGTLVNGKKD